MSNNQAGEFHEFVFLENPVVKKSFVSQTLIDNTLCVVGSSYKGPAFVPMHITNQEDSASVLNTIDNLIGSARQNSVGHLFDELSCNINSQSYHALSMWRQNEGVQASFVRVLGTKSTNSGFNMENVEYDLYSKDESNKNKYVIPQSSDSGSLNFLTKNFLTRSIKINSDVTLDSFTELGITTDNQDFITDVVMCPKGVSPFFLQVPKESLQNFYSEPLNYNADIADERFSISKDISNNSYPEIILRGFDPGQDTTLTSSTDARDNRSFFNLKRNNLSKPQTYSSSWINIFSSKIYENGHHLYASYYDGEMFDFSEKSINYKILHTPTYQSIDDISKPNYNDFSESYKTAKTPWVISQSINSSANTRQEISKNVIDLFRFWSLDDGEVGNRFRIKISLKQRGDADSKIYSKFDLFIMEYDPRDNTFLVSESYENLNLNPESSNYIARRIGTKRKYFDESSKKVYEEGVYDNISQYLRVEVNSDIEFNKLRSDLIPCGFRAYPKIKYEDVFNNDSADVDFMPIPYSVDYFEELPLGENNKIKNSWGVLFRHLRYNQSKNTLALKQENSQKNDISPHYFYTKYFKESNLILDQDELDQSYNSIFSLEKIAVKKSNIDSVLIQDEFTMFYKRSGQSLADYNLGDTYVYEYIDFNKLSKVVAGIRQYSIYKFDETNVKDTLDFNDLLVGKLSFDFFTYGGFDGVNIYDSDKKNLSAKSVSLETFNTQNSQMTNSFELARDAVCDYSNCNGDLLVIPGMRDINFVRKTIDKVAEDGRIMYISDGLYNLDESMISTFSNDIIEKSFASYFKDKVEFNQTRYNEYLANLDNHDKSLIKNQAEVYSLDSLGIDNRNYLSIIGNINVVPELLTLCSQVLDPSLFVAAKMAQGINNKIDSKDFVYEDFNLDLVNNSYLSQTHEDFELLNLNSRRNLFNILYHDLTSELISVRSENTSFRTRRHVFSKQQNVRALQYVKKSVMLDIYTNTSIISGGALFAQISSLQNIYARLKLQLTELFESLVDQEIISFFILDIPIVANDLVMLDMKNNIIRGSVTIKLNNAGTDDIIRLSIQDAINSFAYIQSVDNSIESEILLPASGL